MEVTKYEISIKWRHPNYIWGIRTDFEHHEQYIGQSLKQMQLQKDIERMKRSNRRWNKLKNDKAKILKKW
jgi:hypothetical protein